MAALVLAGQVWLWSLYLGPAWLVASSRLLLAALTDVSGVA